MLYQEQSPGWWYAFLLMPITLFPFAIIAIEHTGLFIAHARFWQKYDKLNTRSQSAFLVYYLLITLLLLPLAVTYLIRLSSENHSSRIGALRESCTWK